MYHFIMKSINRFKLSKDNISFFYLRHSSYLQNLIFAIIVHFCFLYYRIQFLKNLQVSIFYIPRCILSNYF